MKDKLEMIQQAVGPITEEQMVNIDAYPTEKFSVFVPSTGHCYCPASLEIIILETHS